MKLNFDCIVDVPTLQEEIRRLNKVCEEWVRRYDEILINTVMLEVENEELKREVNNS